MATSSLSKWRRNRPFNQNLVAGCMLFCLPGIYLAVTGLGAGGGKPSSAEVSNNVNAINYAVFTLMSLVVGFVLNSWTPKVCLLIGAIGYPVFMGSFWYYDRTGNSWYPYLAAVISGISSGFLWTTAAFIQFSYPEERRKALYISVQWSTRSFGATIGGLIAFAANYKHTSAQGVSNGVYGAFVAIQFCAFILAFCFIVDPRTVVRDDGTHLAIFRRPGLVEELKGLGKAAIDPRFLILLPPMLACEMALALIGSVNSKYFNLRTRALNSLAFAVIQFFVPPILTTILDNRRITSRKVRGMLGIALHGTIAVAACGGLMGWMTINDTDAITKNPAWDWLDHQFPGLFVLYLMFGATYTGFQLATEWTLAATTNDPKKLSKIAGLFKCYSSLGMFISFIMTGQGATLWAQAGLQLSLYAIGTGCVVYVLTRYITDTNYFVEESVIVPHHVEEEALREGKVTEDIIEREHEKERQAAERRQAPSESFEIEHMHGRD